MAQLAAVIGREFSHELLAAVTSLGADGLRDALDRLVGAELVFRHGEPPAAGYSFKHALVRDAAYQSLLKSRRRQLHARVAGVLESRFPDAAESQLELLAHHLAAAGQAEQAIAYLQRASRRALARSADLEAVEHLQEALGQLDRVAPEAEQRETLEFELHLALGRALSTVRGFAAPETGRTFARAATLGQRLQVGARLFPVLWGQFIILHSAGHFVAAHRTAREFVRLARRSGATTGQLVTAERIFGTCEFFLGRFVSARRHLQRALALYDPAAHRDLALDYAYDQRVVTRDLLAGTLFPLGYPEQAERQVRQAVGEAEVLHHRASLAHALAFACLSRQLHDDPAGVLEHAAAMRRLAEEQAIPYWSGRAVVLEGWAVGRAGSPELGIATILGALEALLAIRARAFRPYHLGLLAGTEARAGRYGDALAHVGDALRAVAETGERWYEADLHRLRGELLWRQGSSDAAATVEDALQTALGLARRQAARMWELRAAVSLARVWAETGERSRAYALLAPVHGWFTEGFTTPDLKQAKTLLDELR